ncbi:MAG TPA: hypothetical protein VKG63_19625 [Steroidobacteraceae bacterium]|nr:hypothetical protein [Steroidobacteraceae bacterium]
MEAELINTPANTRDAPAPDAAAAHDFLSELRTRIATQPLPYQYGIEAHALESLWEVFGHARAAMKKYPGCAKFSAAVIWMLNVELRPITAKWQRAHEEGRLDSRDGGDEFRADLANVQEKLRLFAEHLQVMAYGAGTPDELTPAVMTKTDLDELFGDLRFGIDAMEPIARHIVDSINTQEREEVAARRAIYHIDTSKDFNAVGVGLSGGGIRSATFCLGVTQVLAERRLLKDVDFLSTVSGGGYTGSFLTMRLGTGAAQSEVAGPHGPDPPAIRYLRRHAKYLTPIDLKQSWSMVTTTLAGMLLNWTAPLLVIALAALAVRAIANLAPPASLWPVCLAVSSALATLSMVLYAWLIRQSRSAAQWGGWLLAVLTAVTALVGIGWLLSAVYQLDFSRLPWSWTAGLLAGAVATAPVVLRFIPVFETPVLRRIAVKIVLILAGLIIPVMGLALLYAAICLTARPFEVSAAAWNPLHYMDGRGVVGAAAAALAFVAVFLLNVNLTAPHRMYRDLLAATFVNKCESDHAVVPLEDINPECRAPYHLINTTVNLPSSTNPALRDRKGDFFLFSKHWCGSPIVGYHRAGDWRMNASKPDLATAMAVSGAAASSHMGLSAMPTLVALLTFLNIRLGFWIPRPGGGAFPRVPGFLCLIREMIGIGMSETRPWLNLSDGGHIENMATYELLRRRCKYVVCVDGEADPAYTFSGLMILVRHAQLDFGIRIEPRLDDMRPDPKSHYSKTHATLCRIHYPAAADGRPAATGLLLYMRLSVTGNEPELIRRYRLKCPDFPHQSTVDQFFGEEQFEAYRELGVHVAEGLFSQSLMNGSHPVADVPDWFGRLAGNLLEPGTA